MAKRIALAADHAGYEDKEKLKKTLDELGVEYTDMGTDSTESVDYPDFAKKAAEAVAKGEYDQGVLVCGSGTGMAIAANKVPGIRAAVAWNEEIARLARQHNDANVLSLAARYIPMEELAKITKTFLETDFDGGRHERRVEKIAEIEKEDLEGRK
ncbi:MAG: ribose 5-phosphate isomerase B [Acidobacteriota bacterium]